MQDDEHADVGGIPPPEEGFATEEEEPGGPRRARWTDYLKPRHPVEAILLLLIGAGAALAIRAALTSHVTVAPWNLRADRVCLDAGDRFVAVGGTPAQRLSTRIRISQAALAQLAGIEHSVPAQLTARYETLLVDKAHVIRLLEQELAVVQAGRSPAGVDAQLSSYVNTVYSDDALLLGLDVCGRGVGDQ